VITYLRNIWRKLTIQERKHLVLLTMADAGISLLDIAFLGGLLFIVNTNTDPAYLQRMPSWLQAPFRYQPLLPPLLFLFLFGAKNWLGYAIYDAQYRFSAGISARISKAKLESYLHSDYSRFVLTDSSVQLHRIASQPLDFAQYVLRGIQQVITQTLLITVTIAALLLYSPRLFLLLMALLLPVSLLIARLMKVKLQSVRLHIKESWERTGRHLREALSGFIESNIYRRDVFFTERYARENQKLTGYVTRQQSIQGLPARTIEVLAVVGLVILILFNHLLTGTSATPVVTIGAFIASAYKIIPGIVNILNNLGLIKTHLFTVDDIPEPGQSWHNPDQKTNREPLSSIRFDGVYFNYGEDPLLSDFDLQLEAGDCIAISGISGKGKTTIAHLLMGFISQDRGQIAFNHTPMDAEARQKYWPRISYVQQRPFLIHDTILRNITLEEKTTDKSRLRTAVKAAGLAGPANGPLGLNRMIRENGKNISGGQRQRIAFARALYKDFDLLILDEPFSELDADSETLMLEYLQQLSGTGKMILLITHHKANFFFCNKIVLLDGA
jgi:ABC-type multidrug transport system fused ATPase/permease subunit